MAMKLTSAIKGETTGDLEIALEEIRRLIAEGNTSGSNRNDFGGFEFEIDGEGRDLVARR